MKRGLLTVLAVVLLLSCAGVAHGVELPAALADKVEELAPGAEIKRVRTRDRDGVTTYRIRIEFADGRTGDIELMPDGSVRKLDVEILRTDLPAPVRAAADKLYPGADYADADRKIANGQTVFEVNFDRDGRGLQAVFTPEGKLVERDDELDIAALPPAVLERVERDVPGGRITRARRRLDRGRLFLELTVETRFNLVLPDPKGTRTDERRLSVAELPAAVRKAAEERIPGGLQGLRFTEKVTAPVTVYEVDVRRKEKIELDFLDAPGAKPAPAGAEEAF